MLGRREPGFSARDNREWEALPWETMGNFESPVHLTAVNLCEDPILDYNHDSNTYTAALLLY